MLPIGLTVGFFFSGYVNDVLSGITPDLRQLRPNIIIDDIMRDERHRMLTLCVELVITAGIVALPVHRSRYRDVSHAHGSPDSMHRSARQ